MKLYRILGAGLCIIPLVVGCASGPDRPKKTHNHGEPTPMPQAESASKRAKPDLSGDWLLNEELSDDPKEKLKEAKQSGGRGPGGGMGGGGRGMGGGRGDRPGSGSGRMQGARGSARGGLSEWMRGDRSLRITHQEPMLLLVNAQGKKKRLFTDNRGSSILASGGMNQQVSTAGWEKGALVIETTADDGARQVQRYTLDTARRQLSVVSRISLPNRAEPVSIKRVYERRENAKNAR